MLREKETTVRRACILLDGIVICAAFAITYLLRNRMNSFCGDGVLSGLIPIECVSENITHYLGVLWFIVPLWCLLLYSSGIYRSQRTASVLEIMGMLLRATFLTAVMSGSLLFYMKVKFVSRLFFILFISLGWAMLLADKLAIAYIAHRVRKYGYNYRRLLVVGISSRAANFIKKIHKHPEWGFKIEGVLDYERRNIGQEVEGVKVIGALDDISGIIHATPIDDVIFIVPRSGLGAIQKALYVCETAGVKASLAVDFFELNIAKHRQTDLDGVPLIIFETGAGQEWQFFVKRASDIMVSAAALVLLSPLFLAVAAMIKITSPGPVMFLQKRVGLNGRDFIMYKFRTMYKGAHQRLSELHGQNIMSGPVFKIKNDPRVTAVGRVLRKFSIDELPQLINVLVGHMSIVGPRPPLRLEVAKYEPWQRRRLSMRPGLTCLWQISGRNEIGFEDWMKLDLEYIDNWSLWLDVKIILRTVPVVITGKGAY